MQGVPGESQSPELQGIAVIPAGNGMGQGWEVTNDSHWGWAEEVLSPWCPCYLQEHTLFPWPTCKGCSVPQRLLCLGKLGCSAGRTLTPSRPGASEDVLGDPCWSCFLAGVVFWPCQLVRHILQQRHESGDPPVLGKKRHSVLCHEMQVTGGQVWELELPRIVSCLWETKRQQQSVNS